MKKHHIRDELCLTRPKYRQGRELKAVKVYTIAQESQYLLIQGAPSLATQHDLMKKLTEYGIVIENRQLTDYPREEFTEVYLVKFQRIQSARVCKRKLDDTSFLGGVLHICYAPEYETVEETRLKLADRRKAVARRIAQLDAAQTKNHRASTVTAEDNSSPSTDTPHREFLEVGDTVNHNPPGSDERVPLLPQQYPHPVPYQSAQHTGTSVYPRFPGEGYQCRPNSNQRFFHGNHGWNQMPPGPHPYPMLPPPPRRLPWGHRPPPPRPQIDHARVPSSHSTLPAEIQAEMSPWSAPPVPPWKQSPQSENPPEPLSSETEAEEQSPSHGQPQSQPQHLIIKQHKLHGPQPKFVPRQVTKRDPGLQKEFRQTIKDAVNETLRKNAFILEELKGPSLPLDVERKRQDFKASVTADKSLDDTTVSIRSKMKQFSATFLPRQVKKQKTS